MTGDPKVRMNAGCSPDPKADTNYHFSGPDGAVVLARRGVHVDADGRRSAEMLFATPAPA